MKKIIISLAKTLLLTIGCVNESKGKSYMVYYHDVHQDNVQSHGVSHSDMSNMTDEVLKDDLLQSKVMLGNLLDKEIEEVCFPMGYFSDKVIRYAKESGYKLLFSSMPDPKDFANELRGRLFFQTLNPLQVKLSLKGGMSILQNHYQGLHYRKN